jgi:1-acyl-sn-glycerol-3-phosphate acyltransferase
MLGWKLDGITPHNIERLLAVYLPHTSNWDFVIGLLFVKAERIHVTIFGKDAFNFFPFTWCYRYCRVVPIKRHQKSNFVEQAAALYDNGANLWTAMAPEGTRSRVNELKSGYYYLAKTAAIPILVVGLDFRKKSLVLCPSRPVFNSFAEDAENLIEFSNNLTAKRPELRPSHKT